MENLKKVLSGMRMENNFNLLDDEKLIKLVLNK